MSRTSSASLDQVVSVGTPAATAGSPYRAPQVFLYFTLDCRSETFVSFTISRLRGAGGRTSVNSDTRLSSAPPSELSSPGVLLLVLFLSQDTVETLGLSFAE